MGEPQRGDIVDNIFLSVQQEVVLAGEVADKGDFLARTELDNTWVKITQASDLTLALLSGVVQTRVDVLTSTTNTPIECLAAPSYIYCVAGLAMHPGDRVQLNTAATTNFDVGQTVIQATSTELAAGQVIGRFSRLASDQAGNNSAGVEDVIIVKLGVV